MTPHTSPWLKRLWSALTVALAMTIAACGPGTGGTGVGPTSGTYISQGSSTGLTPSVPGSVTSSVTVSASSTGAGAGFVLVLDAAVIRLTGACLAFSFEGPWAEANGEIRVTGSYRLAAPAGDIALAAPQAGTLIARVENTGFTVTLLDARGAVVLIFITGGKVAEGVAVAPAPACNAIPAVTKP